MTAPSPGDHDPLYTLRQYRQLAPWNLRDLASLAGAILESSGVRPLNAAASSRPNERTIRFYVTRGLVTSPDGRGTAATYGYRHLLQVLSIKLWQMEGATLASIADGVVTTDGRGGITYLNPAAEELAGIKNYNVIGRQWHDVLDIRDEASRERVLDPVGSLCGPGLWQRVVSAQYVH